jgi:TRAP-type C4-dicarboxylate transport system substrate-binding protein
MPGARSWYVSAFTIGVLMFAALWFVIDSRARVSAESVAEPIALRWVLPHPPEELFDEAKKIFAEELRDGSGGTLELTTTYFPNELGIEAGDHAFMQLLDDGKAEMVTDYVEHMGQHQYKFLALTLPYLFDDYNSALEFLDGPGAKPLLESLSEESPYHALAFTMSGGFRIFVSKDTPIEKPDDLRGMRVLNAFGGKIIDATAEALGYHSTFDIRSETNPTLELLDGFDATETTYTRIDRLLDNVPSFARYVTETDHAISLTVLVVTNEFYNSLSPQEQKALEKAAQDAARAEKRASIAMTEPMRKRLRELGATVVVLSPEQKVRFKDAVRPVREIYDGKFESVLQYLQSD